MSEAVTRYRPGAQTRGGDRLQGTRAQLEGVDLVPRSSSEQTDGRDTVTIGLTLYGPAGLDVRAGDQIEYAGALTAYHGTWDVEGEPGVWDGGFFTGGPSGTEIALVRVKG